MDISVVIPLYNEEESLPELFAWIQRVMDANHFSYEVIFVNDGIHCNHHITLRLFKTTIQGRGLAVVPAEFDTFYGMLMAIPTALIMMRKKKNE